MTYLQSAFSRLIADLQANKPAEIQTFPTPEDFLERREHAHEVARLLGDYLTSLAIDTEGSTSVKLNVKEITERVIEGLTETDFYCGLTDAAERCAEDRMETALEGV